ncbi:MAG TPA: hypothetical protein VE575_06230 [Acidimicrobiales bacterium]|nr:hypothetical protein [Acidimicrobiales bacterium]
MVLEEVEQLQPSGETLGRTPEARDLADDAAVTIPPDVHEDPPHGTTMRPAARPSHRRNP